MSQFNLTSDTKIKMPKLQDIQRADKKSNPFGTLNRHKRLEGQPVRQWDHLTNTNKNVRKVDLQKLFKSNLNK